MAVIFYGDSHSDAFYDTYNENSNEQSYRVDFLEIAPTMYSIGFNKMNKLNYKKLSQYVKIRQCKDGVSITMNVDDLIKEGDTVVMSCGEVDARCHIMKHSNDLSYDSDIENIVKNYIEVILMNIKQFNNLKVLICSVPPTINGKYKNKKRPLLGTPELRKTYTNCLNKYLKKYCKIHEIPFLDIHDLFTDENGYLNNKYKDKTNHIRSGINDSDTKNIIWNKIKDFFKETC